MSVSFSQSAYSINENDELVQPVLVLNNLVATDVAVQVRTNDNTATGKYIHQHYHKQHVHSNNVIGGGTDYTSGPYYITFPAGAISVSFNININNDDVLEANETFILTIANSSLSDQGFIFSTGAYDKATVIIIDTTSK